MTDLTIETPTTRMPAYVAQPAVEGPWPGVIVIHDAGGMSKDLRRQADWLAGAGYLTVAPDLFSRGNRYRCLFATMGDLRAGSDRSFDDVEAAPARLHRPGGGDRVLHRRRVRPRARPTTGSRPPVSATGPSPPSR